MERWGGGKEEWKGVGEYDTNKFQENGYKPGCQPEF